MKKLYTSIITLTLASCIASPAHAEAPILYDSYKWGNTTIYNPHQEQPNGQIKNFDAIYCQTVGKATYCN